MKKPNKILKKNSNKHEWNPYTSKWKAALDKGLNAKLRGDENILYLGASSGTTISHLCKITSGIIFGVEKAPLMMIPLIRLCQKTNNIAPLFCDARDAEYIREHIYNTPIDILFQDIPSIDQVNIIKKASNLVGSNCRIFLSLKTQSISQKDWKKTAQKAKKELEKSFEILDCISLEPFHQKHFFFVMKKLQG